MSDAFQLLNTGKESFLITFFKIFEELLMCIPLPITIEGLSDLSIKLIIFFISVSLIIFLNFFSLKLLIFLD